MRSIKYNKFEDKFRKTDGAVFSCFYLCGINRFNNGTFDIFMTHKVLHNGNLIYLIYLNMLECLSILHIELNGSFETNEK